MACKKRHFLLSICIVQMIVVIWRQVFDYLGFMWGPIIVNFFQIIFVIFGFFGAWQSRSKYMICYTIWSIFWCGWNAFVICFYENVGILNREWDLLNLGTGSVSWWEGNGPGCKAVFLGNETAIETEPWRPLRPHLVSNCLVPYHHLEAAQASFNLILAAVGAIIAISMIGSVKKEDDSAPPVSKSKKISAPLYSVEYTPHRINDIATESMDEGEIVRGVGGGGCRPMTPRRVKRRSIHSRGTSYPPGGGSSGGGGGSSGGGAGAAGGPPGLPIQQHTLRRSHHRSSKRSSGRRHRTNPVTKLIDQAQLQHEMGGHTNMMYQTTSVHSLGSEVERPGSARSSYSNYHGTRTHSYRHSHNFLATGPPAYTSQSETAI